MIWVNLTQHNKLEIDVQLFINQKSIVPNKEFQMRYFAFLLLKVLQNGGRSKLEVRKKSLLAMGVTEFTSILAL